MRRYPYGNLYISEEEVKNETSINVRKYERNQTRSMDLKRGGIKKMNATENQNLFMPLNLTMNPREVN